MILLHAAIAIVVKLIHRHHDLVVGFTDLNLSLMPLPVAQVNDAQILIVGIFRVAHRNSIKRVSIIGDDIKSQSKLVSFTLAVPVSSHASGSIVGILIAKLRRGHKNKSQPCVALSKVVAVGHAKAKSRQYRAIGNVATFVEKNDVRLGSIVGKIEIAIVGIGSLDALQRWWSLNWRWWHEFSVLGAAKELRRRGGRREIKALAGVVPPPD